MRCHAKGQGCSLTVEQLVALDALPLPDETDRKSGDDLCLPPDIALRCAVIQAGWSKRVEMSKRLPAYRDRLSPLDPILPTQVYAMTMGAEPIETWAKVHKRKKRGKPCQT